MNKGGVGRSGVGGGGTGQPAWRAPGGAGAADRRGDAERGA